MQQEELYISVQPCRRDYSINKKKCYFFNSRIFFVDISFQYSVTILICHNEFF